MTMPEVFEDAIRMRKKVAMTFFSMDEGQIVTLVYIPLEFGAKAWHYDKKAKFYHCLSLIEDGTQNMIYLREKQVRHIAMLEEAFEVE
jgi:hypothetical protein